MDKGHSSFLNRAWAATEAEQDPNDIWDYIAASNPHAAARMDKLFSVFNDVLVEEPEVRQRLKELLDEITIDEVLMSGKEGIWWARWA